MSREPDEARPAPVPQLSPRRGRVHWRLFLAVPVPPTVAASLDEALEPYRAAHPGVRWADRGSFHLTLLFLGAVDPAQADRLAAIARDVASRGRPFEVRTGAAGGSLRHAAADGVAWLRLASGGHEVIVLGDALAARITPGAIAGDRAPRRAPSAHLTIARRATRDALDDLTTSRHGPVAASWTADRIVLVRSQLGPDRARHGTLAMARLGDPA